MGYSSPEYGIVEKLRTHGVILGALSSKYKPDLGGLYRACEDAILNSEPWCNVVLVYDTEGSLL